MAIRRFKSRATAGRVLKTGTLAQLTDADDIVTTAERGDGVAGTLDLSLYTLTSTVVSTIDAAKADILNTRTLYTVTGTFDEAARNTDPGESNVADGVTYKILNVAKEGTLVGSGGGIDPSDIVAAQYVLTGHVNYVGGDDGTLTLPATDDVDGGVLYGVGGNGSEGTGMTEAEVEAAITAALEDAELPTAEEIWTRTPRTLTMPPAAVLAVLTGTALAFRRGDSVEVDIPLDRDVSTATAVVFSVKRHPATDEDVDAVLQVTLASGLTRLNAQAPDDATLADLTVDGDEATLTIHGTVTAELTPTTALTWDIQIIDADGDPITVAEGKLTVSADVTRATT